jgi:hypothetical protein
MELSTPTGVNVPAQRTDLYDRVLAVPGVESAGQLGLRSSVPPLFAFGIRPFVAGHRVPAPLLTGVLSQGFSTIAVGTTLPLLCERCCLIFGTPCE